MIQNQINMKKLLIKHMLEQVKVNVEEKREEMQEGKSHSQTSILPPTNWFMTASLTD